MIYIYEDKAIYEEKEHEQDMFSISLGTLELFFSLNNRFLEYVQGYFPLDFVKRRKIDYPEAALGNYELKLENIEPQKGMVYNYFSRCPSASRLFTLENTAFDPDQAMIVFGVDNDAHKRIKINQNLTVSVDELDRLTCLYVHFDEMQ